MCTTGKQFLGEKVSLNYSNTNLSEILNEIGCQLNVNFFLISNQPVIVKEMEVKNQTLQVVLNTICKLFNLHMTINHYKNITLSYKEPVFTKMYKLRFFHTNNINNNSKIFWDNNIFWDSIEKFLLEICQKIVIDKYNGYIIATCDNNQHKLIANYLKSIEKKLYKPIEIECVFLETVHNDSTTQGLGKILSDMSNQYDQIDSLIKVFVNNISKLTKNKYNKSTCKIIARQKILILPQQVALISIEDLEERKEKQLIYGKHVVSNTTSFSNKLVNGLSFYVSPIEVNNKIICKICLQINRCFKEKNSINKQSNLTTTIKLEPNKILVVGDLISHKRAVNSNTGLLGKLFSFYNNKIEKSSIAIILKGDFKHV